MMQEEITLTAAEWQAWWDSLKWIDQHLKRATASARAFGWIWRRCRAKVTAAHRLYLPELADRFGVTIANAQYYVDYLQNKELLWVRNRTLSAKVPQGWVVMDVYHPNPELRNPPFRVDPQRLFGFMEDPDRAPPFAAHGPFSHLCHKGPTKVQEGTFVKGPTKVQKRPCEDAILDAVASSQLSCGEAFAMISEGDSSGGSSRARARVKLRSLRLRQRLKLKPETSRASTPYNDQSTGQEFFDRILTNLGDPELQPAPVRKVAQKLVEGSLDWETVQTVIDAARFKFRQGVVEAPWKYFVGAMRRIFEEDNGWQWRRPK